MNSENDLMQKLVVAKKIMDAHNKTPRVGNSGGIPSTPMLEQFNAPPAMYNIPQEYMTEQKQVQPQQQSQLPVKDKILNSRLPDEIKRLMIEHPIAQAQQQQQATLSDDLIERASRLMKNETNNYVPDSAKLKQQPVKESSNLDLSKIQQMIESAVEKALQKNGMIVESVEKTGELFSFKVGKHIFEGKVTKIKKLS